MKYDDLTLMKFADGELENSLAKEIDKDAWFKSKKSLCDILNKMMKIIILMN